MKKLTKALIIASIAILVLTFAACGAKYADSKYVGSWKSDTVTMSGISVKYEMTMDIKEDGSFSFKAGSSEGKGDWEEKDGKFVFKQDDASIIGAMKGEKMHIKLAYGSSSFTSDLTKQ